MLEQFLSDPSKVGMIGLLAIAVVAFWKGWVIPGTTHTAVIAQITTQYEARLLDTVKDKNEFKDMLLKAADTADRAIAVAQKTAGT